MKKLRPAIFLDRDGIINKVSVNNNKVYSPRKFCEFEVIPEIRDVLCAFKKLGFVNIVITNQPDISRGLMSVQELEKMHNCVKENLPVDDIFVCSHSDEDNCLCRKPKPEMLLEAIRKWNIDITNSFLIGDSWRDIEAGNKAGCHTILIETSYNKDTSADYKVGNIMAAMEIIRDKKLKKRGLNG